MWKSPWCLNPDKLMQTAKKRLREGEIVFPRKSTAISQYEMLIPENMHKRNIIQTDQFVFRNTYILAYLYMHIIVFLKVCELE